MFFLCSLPRDEIALAIYLIGMIATTLYMMWDLLNKRTYLELLPIYIFLIVAWPIYWILSLAVNLRYE